MTKRAGDAASESAAAAVKQAKSDDAAAIVTLSSGEKYEWTQTEHSLSLTIRSATNSGGRSKLSIHDGYLSISKGDAEPWLLQKLAEGVSEQLGGSSSSSGKEGRVETFTLSKNTPGVFLPQLLLGELTAVEKEAYRAEAAKRSHVPQALRTFLDLWGPELEITVSDISVTNKVSRMQRSKQERVRTSARARMVTIREGGHLFLRLSI